ncbi:helix-turn-helix transcriptional regulator [Sporosarcina sp. P26b]|uniref:helix-turn-helix domain-containing protein n=1 Tax=Sporosarcina sp. P26b TaxID=2048253 RepID=UPI0013047625|nr:helix-turn-helix transcriptional regulator [Sporosarcina sp. P26b]
MIKYNLLLNTTNYELTHHQQIANKIERFQVIIMYDRQPNFFDYNYLLHFPCEKVRKKVNTNRIFPRVKNETFIVRQQSYEENIQLFFKQRMNARYEMLAKVTEFMTAKFFSTYESHLVPLLENKPTLKWEIINKLYSKYEKLLSEHARFNDEESWNAFSTWYRTYLTNHTVNEMLEIHGYDTLNILTNEDINKLFLEILNRSFASNDSFLNTFTDAVNVYIEKMVSEILAVFELEKDSMVQINELLGVSDRIADHQPVESSVKTNNLVVMSNAVYQFITEAISNQKFTYERDQWPKATIRSTTLSGSLQLLARKEDRTASRMNQLQEQAKTLSEVDVDVLDSLCHMYLAQQGQAEDRIAIRFDDLLTIRGLKTKLGGTGRRGGYEKEQRTQVIKALSILQSLWLEFDTVLIYEQGKPVNKTMAGRAFIFTNEDGSPCELTERTLPEHLYVKIGEVFNHFLQGSTRQVKLLPNQAIELNPYQRKWEKKLIRYISWRWRTQARKASYLQPHKISTLLEKIGIQIDTQAPSRIRDRLEKALDLLEEEGVITFWQYNQWNEDSMSKKGWLRVWLDATIIIAPPDEIVSYYEPIERKKSVKTPTNFSLEPPKEKVCKSIGSDFKECRIKRGLTLKQVSDQLKISTSYISNIERGGALPSQTVYKKMKEWLN